MTTTAPPKQGPTSRSSTTRFGRSSRYYETPDGRFPSVTTILSAIAKPALVNWAASTEKAAAIEAAADLYEDLPQAGKRMIRAVYVETLTRRIGTVKAHTKALVAAAEIGSQAHARIEWVLRKDLGQTVGQEPRIGEKALWASLVFEEWRTSVGLKPKAIEQTVWHAQRKYAGSMDWWADATLPDLGPGTIVGDQKTGKAIYGESLLQNAAYVHALIAMGHATPPVHGVIVRLPKVDTDPEPEIRVIPWEEQQGLYAVFLAVKALWHFLDAQEAAYEAQRAAQPGLAGARA